MGGYNGYLPSAGQNITILSSWWMIYDMKSDVVYDTVSTALCALDSARPYPYVTYSHTPFFITWSKFLILKTFESTQESCLGESQFISFLMLVF